MAGAAVGFPGARWLGLGAVSPLAAGSACLASKSVEIALLVAYRLPLTVAVTGECLGLRLQTPFGGADVEIRIPHDQAPNESLDEDDFSLMRRARDAEASDAPATDAITSARREFDQPETVARDAEGPIELERLLIGVAPTIDRLGETRRGVGSSVEARLQDELYIHANRWHDAFRTWIEVMTAQDLDHVHRRWSADIEGASMATFTTAGVRTLSGGRIRLDTHDETPARPGLLRHALTEAGQQHYPPLAPASAHGGGSG